MKFTNTLIIGSLVFASLATYAQDKGATKKSTTAEPKATQANPEQDAANRQNAWETYMQVGEAQKRLSLAEGDWIEQCTFWMAPGAPPTKSEAKCSTKMILGGRYQESVHSGQMMGMDFEGRSIIGYDNALKVYQYTWIDNMGTGTMHMQGKMDEKTNTINYTGKMVDPMSGKEDNVRQVVKIIDDKTMQIQMFAMKNGKEFKSMEIMMTKK